ncbi:MAG: histone deacetylase family protein [Bdellovibrionales bacterium]|nr:histone deacetylase family protein [Bdellovibrionales bacterium]
MFRLRQINHLRTPHAVRAADKLFEIARRHFYWIDDAVEHTWRERMRLGHDKNFTYFFFVAEGANGNVRGFSIFSFDPVLRFGYLDLLAVDKNLKSGGIGTALYQRILAELSAQKARAMFIEAESNHPSLNRTPEQIKQNSSRLRFYERLGAKVLPNEPFSAKRKDGSGYELLLDSLGAGYKFTAPYLRDAVQQILRTKNSAIASKAFIERAVHGVDRTMVEEANTVSASQRLPKSTPRITIPEDRLITLTVNDGHDIHHIPDKGYEEAPVRVASLLKELIPTGLFNRVKTKAVRERQILAVHSPEYFQYLKTICRQIGNNRIVYPEVFPVRHRVRPPTKLAHQVGYYCIDSFSPLSLNAFVAAKGAASCAVTAADAILDGQRLAYALVRPPGHHAEREHCGGFCYLNSTAIAAQHLSKHGSVAILDIDYHHGNGQQDIFYERSDVLTLSIHADPAKEYPYFSGFPEERGSGPGEGFNHNVCVKMGADWQTYRERLLKALKTVRQFSPTFLVVALGFDTAKGDPTGSFQLRTKDFYALGKEVASIDAPTLFVQEGGYRTATLGKNARQFFTGVWASVYETAK